MLSWSGPDWTHLPLGVTFETLPVWMVRLKMFSNKKTSSYLAEVMFFATIVSSSTGWADDQDHNVDRRLSSMLRRAGFTGRVESTIERRLGRSLNPKLANLGRLLWFDNAGGLHSDNTCGGCHSPTNGFG